MLRALSARPPIMAADDLPFGKGGSLTDVWPACRAPRARAPRWPLCRDLPAAKRPPAPTPPPPSPALKTASSGVDAGMDDGFELNLGGPAVPPSKCVGACGVGCGACLVAGLGARAPMHAAEAASQANAPTNRPVTPLPLPGRWRR